MKSFKFNLFSFTTLIVIFVIPMVVGSCQKEEEDFILTEEGKEDLDQGGNDFVCLTSDPEDGESNGDSTEQLESRGAGTKTLFWNPGQTLRVRFLGGTTFQKDKVKQYVVQWSNTANIKFQFISSGTSEIRVSFTSGSGNWSQIGKNSINVPQNQATMNLDFNSSTSEVSIRRVVLHEFGHSLGMVHEHQQPFSNILWKKSVVYAYFANNFGWSAEKVNHNIFNKKDLVLTQFTNYDPKSVMHYSILSGWTTNGYTVSAATQLSTMDKDFMQKKYSSKTIKIRWAASSSYYSITFQMNGIYYTFKPGETVQASAYTSGNKLYIWECPYGSNCTWDGPYVPLYGKKYKIINYNGGFKLVLD